MSREQWGHGYWKGVEDAQTGNVRLALRDQVKFWIAHMCFSNCGKFEDRSLYPVKSFISMMHFCGLSEKYAKKIYNYILEHNFYDLEPGGSSYCYVSGSSWSDWKDDYFVIPIYEHSRDEWLKIIGKLIPDEKGFDNV